MKYFRRAIFVFVVAVLAVNSFALDRMWNMRYTYGPDARPSPKFAAGVGMRSNFGDNVLFPINIMGQLAKDWDVGAKVDVYTYNELENVVASVDLGGRMRFGGAFLEVDGYFGLNRDNGNALVVTYGKENYIAKNFSNTFETRAGFFDGVTGPDGIVKLGMGIMPTLHFGKSFLCMIEITSSGSIGEIKDDFMVDILPKIELGFGSTRIKVEFDIGILQETNNDQKSIALYILTLL